MLIILMLIVLSIIIYFLYISESCTNINISNPHEFITNIKYETWKNCKYTNPTNTHDDMKPDSYNDCNPYKSDSYNTNDTDESEYTNDTEYTDEAEYTPDPIPEDTPDPTPEDTPEDTPDPTPAPTTKPKCGNPPDFLRPNPNQRDCTMVGASANCSQFWERVNGIYSNCKRGDSGLCVRGDECNNISSPR